MNAIETFHLRAFRGALRDARTACTIGAVSFDAVKNRRVPDATSIETNVGTTVPESFTVAIEDLTAGLPEQGEVLLTETDSYRVIGLRNLFPLVHIDCGAPVPLA